MPKGFVYILECSDGSYYTGSTIDLSKRITEHQNGQGANHTKKRLPIKLVFAEEFNSISEAFDREKQIQGWNRNKKEALILQNYNKLPELSECMNESHHKNYNTSLRHLNRLNTKDVVSTTLNQQSSENNQQTKTKDNTLTFHSNGKLLITAEYVVLDGAKALALPTKFGQSLTIIPTHTEYINWQSIDNNGEIWFEDQFSLNTLQSTQSNPFSDRLSQIFEAIDKLQPNFFTKFQGLDIQTRLEFDRDWGLGSSSTLINNLADWANIDAYKLLELTFGGSGYDIACASHDTAIFYQLNSKTPQIELTTFNPNFKSELHFIHLNKKQNSRDGIAHYKAQKTLNSRTIEAINKISNNLITCATLSVFEALIDQHEDLISKTINLQPIKSSLFPDFKGSIKSLGAWGGDFILVTGTKTYCEAYFKSKGYHTIISFKDMIK